MELQMKTNPDVEMVFNKYPAKVKRKIRRLRSLIIEAAQELEGLRELEETLKWGEPSYLAKRGSTIRIDWKKNKPDQYAMYFSCSSSLVATFKVVYKNTFSFEGNRAIIFALDNEIPEEALKNCISVALTYHKIKHLPLLGL